MVCGGTSYGGEHGVVCVVVPHMTANMVWCVVVPHMVVNMVWCVWWYLIWWRTWCGVCGGTSYGGERGVVCVVVPHMAVNMVWCVWWYLIWW